MEASTRLQILARLATSNTDVATAALRKAFEQAATTLATGTDYDDLLHALEVMSVVGSRFSDECVREIDGFVRSVEERQVDHAARYQQLFVSISKYRNAHSLMSKGIEVLALMRYLETQAVMMTLLWASTSNVESVSKAAHAALAKMAKYDLSVYSGMGTSSGRGIGAAPQLQIISSLEKMGDVEVRAHLAGALGLLSGLLSSTMEASTWSSNAVTLSRAAIPADQKVADVRLRSLRLLKRLFHLVETLQDKLAIIQTLNAATRAEAGTTTDEAYWRMMSENTREVLSIYADIANSSELPLVQKIEHHSYWIFYHARAQEVREAALAVKAVIDTNHEYEIYKTLIGFEGIFGEWSRDDRDATRELASQAARTQTAKTYVAQMPSEGFAAWRERILTFAQTRSIDMATFPVFYEFLGDVAATYPDFALDLLMDHSEQLSPFLIPLLRGLWDGEKREQVRTLIVDSVQHRGEKAGFLYASAKVFLSTKEVDIGMMEWVLTQAVRLKSTNSVQQIVSVAIARYDSAKEELKALFLQALHHLSALGDASWVSDIWYRQEAEAMIATLSPQDRLKVLSNLMLLPEVDYQAEEILTAIAKEAPEEVVRFFCNRIYDQRPAEPHSENSAEFEDVPYQFHNLQGPLSKIPAAAVRIVYAYYLKDGSLFQFRGAKLLQCIFPELQDEFRDELIRMIQSGGEPEWEFVSAVLRAYHGQKFVHPVAKELVKLIPSGNSLLDEVTIALETTGVVSGEYGMSHAYDEKRLEVLEWLQDPNDKVRSFASSLIAELERMRDDEKARADESIKLRKFRYGEL